MRKHYFKHILLAMQNIDKNVALIRPGIVKVCTQAGISYVVFRRIRLLSILAGFAG